MQLRWRYPGFRTASVVCCVIGAIAGVGQFGGAQESMPKPTPTAPACVRPNVPVSVVHAVRGVVSPMAEQQGLYGRVDVVVSLDADSRIVGARILRTPAGILNQPAIDAARASTFQTEILGCRPIASDVIYTVDFPVTITYATGPSGERTISVLAGAAVTRAPDVAYVEARIATHDDAIFEALKTKLRTLGVVGSNIRTTLSTRGTRIDVTVDAVPNAGSVASAMASVSGVDVLGVRYALNNHASAYREARDMALKDAEARANRLLTPQRASLGRLLRDDLPKTDGDTPPTEFVRFSTRPAGTPSPTLTIPAIQVRAEGTVTYAIIKA